MGLSIGAFEHFGYKNYPLFFDTVARTRKFEARALHRNLSPDVGDIP
jgi:cyclopropane fatty-acyl-phospholipid synthase-like methyltransferase